MKYLFLLFLSAVYSENISKKFVHRNNQFTIKVLGELGRNHHKNVVFSAFPLETVLGLTTLGAGGNTAIELKKFLQLPESDDEVKSEFKKVHDEVNHVKNVQIASANHVYLAKNLNIEPEFIKTALDVFGAGVQNTNFSDNKNAAAEISKWVYEKTGQKIKDLIKKDQLSESTKMVLVSSLYFKGEWTYPFDPSKTMKRDFHISQNETVQVDTMELTANLFVHRNPKYKHLFLRMPYAGTENRATITIVVPDEVHELPELQKNLTHAVPEQNYSREYIKIFLPKFKVEATTDLKPILENLGLTDLFSEPNLSRITTEPIKVDAIAQKVFINVDEYGTEAAPGTAEILATRTIAGKAIAAEYHIDRPFFFCLQYDEVALLTGRIINPLQG